MLSTSPTRCSTDHSFFSASKLSMVGASTSSAVVVTTRLTRRPSTTRSTSSSASSSLTSSPASSSVDLPKKRKSSPPQPGPSAFTELPREVKRLRATPKRDKGPKRKTSSKASSRAASRQVSTSPEPIYRSSRSRSTSLFPHSDPDLSPKRPPRRWCTDEDGTPGPDHLSSEMVVKKLMKSYKTC